MKNSFGTNIKFAFLAQSISLCLSVLMSLIVPKILGIEIYGYWQLFMFYIVYTNLFHFGVSDGIYLRKGGEKYSELDYSLLNSDFYVTLGWQIIIAFLLILFALFFVEDPNRAFVFIATAVYMLVYNAVSFLGLLFQAVNETKIYSLSVIIDKLLFILIVLVFMVWKVSDFKVLVIGYIFSTTSGLTFLCLVGREIVFKLPSISKKVFDDIKENIISGFPLTLSAFTSNFIVGISRATVDSKWGILVFGKFSFAISMTNFFLLFIRQISMVLFPALRMKESAEKESLFYKMNQYVNYLFPLIFLAYFPAGVILNIWLPQYQESITYLALLLPLCFFDGKTQMIYMTYMKDYRKERILLGVNIFSVIMSAIFSFIGAFLLNNVFFVLVGIVITSAIRSVILEWYVSERIYSHVSWKHTIQIIFFVIVFMGTYLIDNRFIAFTVLLIISIFYYVLNRNFISMLFKSINRNR